MKKRWSFLLVLVLLMGLVGCGTQVKTDQAEGLLPLLLSGPEYTVQDGEAHLQCFEEAYKTQVAKYTTADFLEEAVFEGQMNRYAAYIKGAAISVDELKIEPLQDGNCSFTAALVVQSGDTEERIAVSGSVTLDKQGAVSYVKIDSRALTEYVESLPTPEDLPVVYLPESVRTRIA